jgi:uracil phosphoribosyltransferase
VLYEISLLLFYAATEQLALDTYTLQTPLEETKGQRLSIDKPIIIPILRAGLGMLEAFLTLIPTARVAHIGLKRDEQTLQSHCYYFKIPTIIPANAPIFICDPMLATGGTATKAIDLLKQHNLTQPITLVTIVCAPEGLATLQADHPEVVIYTASLDRQLNQKAYILPGLGDAGDRLNGTC